MSKVHFRYQTIMQSYVTHLLDAFKICVLRRKYAVRNRKGVWTTRANPSPSIKIQKRSSIKTGTWPDQISEWCYLQVKTRAILLVIKFTFKFLSFLHTFGSLCSIPSQAMSYWGRSFTSSTSNISFITKTTTRFIRRKWRWWSTQSSLVS